MLNKIDKVDDTIDKVDDTIDKVDDNLINKKYIVYLLINTTHNKTYLGITNNSVRRLRQHNGELKGGARYTASFKGEGEWVYYLKISNLTKSEALSIERTAKNKRRKAKGNTPLQKRLYVLLPILEKYTDIECTYFK